MSAGATMIALAAAANNVDISIQCVVVGGTSISLSERDGSSRDPKRRLEVTLWLTLLPVDVAEKIRAVSHRSDQETSSTFTGMTSAWGVC